MIGVSSTYGFLPPHQAPRAAPMCEAVVSVVVYMATNLTNGKKYIGVTKTTLEKRSQQHFAKAANGSKYKFHCAIRKYGRGSFKFEVLHTLYDYREALQCEIETIDCIKPEYNSTKGGEGVVGMFISDEHRRAVSEANIGNRYWVGKKHRPESIEKMRLARTGTDGYWKGKKRPPISAETSAKLKENHPRYWLGKKRDRATVDKMLATRAGTPTHENSIKALIENHSVGVDASAKKRRKEIVCLDDGMIFSCAREAAQHYGLNWRSVHKAIRHPHKLHGLSFRYELDNG